MKIFNRILFALIAAMGLYLVIDLSNERVVNQYINENGQRAIETEDFGFFVSARYYHQDYIIEDTFSFNEHTFSVKVFNVANIIEINGDYEVVEGFHIIFHQIDGPIFDYPFKAQILTDSEDIEIEFIGIKINKLPIYTFVSGRTRSTFFNQDLLKSDDVFYETTGLNIIIDEASVEIFNMTIKATDFKLTEALESYIEVYGELPISEFDEVKYAPVIQIDSSDLMIRNSAIYVAIVVVATVLLFVVKRKHMGRKKATEGLSKDIEKVQSQHTEKR